MIRNHVLGGKSNKLVLFAALFLGLIAAISVYVFLSQGQGEEGGASAVTKPVVVAKEDIAAATRITASMVEVKSISADAVHPAALTSTEGVLDKVARYPIAAGEQVLEDKLVTSAIEVGGKAESAPLSVTIPSGKRAVAVEFKQVIGAGGMIFPGDFVDVIAVFPKTDDRVPVVSPSAVTVLQNVQVLAIDQDLGTVVVGTSDGSTAEDGVTGAATERVVTGDSEPNPEAATATLAVTPREAQILTLAEGCADQDSGYLRLSLRPFGEDSEAALGPLWMRSDVGAPDDCPTLVSGGR